MVEALKAEPKQARSWRGDVGLAGRVSGRAQSGAGFEIRLERGDGWAVTTRVDAEERYEFIDVPMASYRVLVVGTERSREVTLTRERPAATANFDLSGINLTRAASILGGTVRGGAGQTVRLGRR